MSLPRQPSEVSADQPVQNDRGQRVKDTPTLHQKLLNFTQQTESTIIVEENIEIEELEDKEQTEKNTEPSNEETMLDVSSIWDSSIKQSWKDPIPNSNINPDETVSQPIDSRTVQQKIEGNIANFKGDRHFAKFFSINAEGMAVDLIELCEELFEYGDIAINYSKVSMSGKSVVIQFLNETGAFRATGHKGTYLTYENTQSHGLKQSAHEETYYRVTAVFTKSFRGVFSTPNEVKNFLLNSKLSDNFRKEQNFDTFKFKTQPDGKTILSIYLNNRESWVELSKQEIVRGPKGYIRILGHLSATNDKDLTHLWMGNLKDLTDGIPLMKALEFRDFHPVIASIAHDQKRGIPKGFGFIYMPKVEADQILELDPPLMYEENQVKFSASIRASDLIRKHNP